MSMKEEYTAIDMSTAAADGFRDGQRAAQSAPVENEAFAPGSLADLLFQLGEKGVRVSGGTHGDRWRVRLPQTVAAQSAPAGEREHED